MYARYSAVIGTMALSFQVLVLEPWHEQISHEIRELKEQVARKSDDSNPARVHSKLASAFSK